MNKYKDLLQEGFRDFSNATQCPYEKNTARHDAWKRGWEIAFDVFCKLEEIASKKLQFFTDECCIVEMQRESFQLEWVTEGMYGPFNSREAAREWTLLPENCVGNNPKFRYRIIPLINPNEK